jgi:DNA-directed RNA polymerase specialized sigma subunit
MAEQVTIQDAFDETWGKKKKPKEWEDAYEKWRQDQSQAELQNVVKRLQPVVDSAINRYVGQKAPPTVRQRARILTAKAVQSYDPDRGAGLNTHVYNQLRALQRMSPGISDPFAPPERFRRQQTDIKQATDKMFEELGRDPTDEEIADVTGLPSSRVQKVRNRMRARIPLSVYEDSFDDDDESPDVVGSERTKYDEWIDAVYEDLGEIDRLILMYRTGYRNADVLSNQEIAMRLNISPAAVSQRARRIQQRLDQFHAPA